MEYSLNLLTDCVELDGEPVNARQWAWEKGLKVTGPIAERLLRQEVTRQYHPFLDWVNGAQPDIDAWMSVGQVFGSSPSHIHSAHFQTRLWMMTVLARIIYPGCAIPIHSYWADRPEWVLTGFEALLPGEGWLDTSARLNYETSWAKKANRHVCVVGRNTKTLAGIPDAVIRTHDRQVPRRFTPVLSNHKRDSGDSPWRVIIITGGSSVGTAFVRGAWAAALNSFNKTCRDKTTAETYLASHLVGPPE